MTELEVRHDSETGKYVIWNVSENAPAINSRTGKRIDGGGHDFKDKAERQLGYITGARPQEDRTVMGNISRG